MELRKYEKNITSQFGEDGVIEEIFLRIGVTNKTCIEFGAWDGKHLSNTWRLWNELGWKTYLIEGDKSRFEELKRNTSGYSNVVSINAFVDVDGKFSLDSILERANAESEIDLLSIDIDSDDYYIFNSLKNYRPRLVIVEYNPTIPPHIELVQKKGELMGCSALSLIKLGRALGYEPIHMTTTNVFFLLNEEFEKGYFETIDINEMYQNNIFVYVISDYAGKTYLTSKIPYSFYKKDL